MRLRSSLVFLVVLFAILAVKAVQIQVVHGSEYEALAQRQQVREFTTSSKRGVIYDRNGEELAVSRRMASIVADPLLVQDPAAAAQALAPILGLEASTLADKLAGDNRFAFLARKVDPALGRQVLDLGLRGISVQPEEKRVYPKGALAPQVLGFVGTDNVGLAGIEKQYDEQLTGVSGTRAVVGDPFGRTLGVIFDKEGEKAGRWCSPSTRRSSSWPSRPSPARLRSSVP